MKKLLAVLLVLAILLPVVPVTKAKAAEAKPFYGLTWDEVDRNTFSNLENAPIITVKNNNGEVTITHGSTYPELMAEKMKEKLDALPEGMRYIRIFKPAEAFKAGAELVVYADAGISQLKTLFTEFIEAYYDLDGKLDGIILDTEYTAMGSWYLYLNTYGGHYKPSADKIAANNYNRNLYHDIVNHPKYLTDIRPLLEESGFRFYENVGGDRSEIWSMYPTSTIKQVLKGDALTEHLEKYTGCYEIWNRVMKNRQSRYLNDAILNPLLKHYPNAVMSDYQQTDAAPWHKQIGSYANSEKVGNTSNSNDYSHLPSASYFVDDGVYLYQKPNGYNGASYDDDPYGMLLWNINKFKSMYAATDTKKISVWIAEYDYSSRAGSYLNNGYYTESLYHYGMLDPQPFLVYMYTGSSKFKGTEGKEAYNKRMQVISEILNELTRVAGFSDRKVIEVPASWNDGYVLTGMYAGGRNIWRITPDTTDGTTLDAFKMQDKDPTFQINGTTITFPQGTILQDSKISVVGSNGYWVETPKDVMPVVTRDADRYSKYPSYMEDFSSYQAGTAFTSATTALPQTWNITADKSLVITDGKLALTGTATLKNVKLPANITAGDSYAQRQAWEVSVKLPQTMNANGVVTLLATPTDGGFKLEGDKIYYDENGTYQAFSDIVLSTGQEYILKREMNFAANTCAYSVYQGSTLLKQVTDVKLKSLSLPVAAVAISCSELTTQVLVDDYKLYPTGFVQTLEVYDANGGEKLSSAEKLEKSRIGYRLAWMNATAVGKTVKVKAATYDSGNKLISETVLATVTMAPGADGILADTVNNQGAKLTIYLEEVNYVPPEDVVETPDGGVFDDPEENPYEDADKEPGKTPDERPSVTPNTDAAEKPGTDSAVTPGDNTPNGEGKSPMQKPAASKGKAALWIVIGVVAVATAGTGVFFVLKKKMPRHKS